MKVNNKIEIGFLNALFILRRLQVVGSIKVHKSEIVREPGVWWCPLVLNMYSQWLQNEYTIYWMNYRDRQLIWLYKQKNTEIRIKSRFTCTIRHSWSAFIYCYFCLSYVIQSESHVFLYVLNFLLFKCPSTSLYFHRVMFLALFKAWSGIYRECFSLKSISFGLTDTLVTC